MQRDESPRIAFQLTGPDDPGYDETRWKPCDGSEELIEGMEDFLARTNDDATSHEVFQKIREQARDRVTRSRRAPES